ncbi:hypothetical protein GCM10027020_30670 [Nocardioides salsibiostraticola]
MLAGRYRLVDLLTETGGGRFWRAHDQVLERTVALHILDAQDRRSTALLKAARSSATVQDARLLRVLDAEVTEGVCYVVNEWGSGTSLDLLISRGPLGPRRAAWLVAEVADSLATAHSQNVPHGHLVPENILVDQHGEIRIIGHGVDAALRGLTLDRPGNDVLDLAGLLYCALTTRWGGPSESVVPPAPTEHHQVLRPRRVRAGVPRPLDVLCDAVLHPHLGRRDLGDITTAAGIRDYLTEYVGDPAGIPAALLASCPDRREPDQVVLPAAPELAASAIATLHQPGQAVNQAPPQAPTHTPAQPSSQSAAQTPAQTPAQPPPQPAASDLQEDRPTEAGLPIFGDDEDDVEWFQARASRPKPPPAFEEPASRPLFAPDPEGGGPVRTPRRLGERAVDRAQAEQALSSAPAGYGLSGDTSTDAAPVPRGFWPWETMGGSRATTERAVEQSGAGPGAGALLEAEDEVPGRNWVRLGIGALALLVLAVSVLVAFTVTRGPGAEPDADPSTDSASPSADPSTTEPLTGLQATDLDPAGTPVPEENPELAPLAVDGDRSTVWQTEGYFEQLGPQGLKTGVGLTIDLGATTEVTDVRVFFQGTPTDVELYLTDEVPTDVEGLEPISTGTATEEGLVLTPDSAPSGRYLVVWLTALPADGDRFRGRVAEVVVRGASR